MSDPLAALWADAWVARYSPAPRPETADELAKRLVGEARTAALDRALADLAQGREARQSEIDVFQGDPHLHLRYLDARDEALARHDGDLVWQGEPEGEDEQ